MFHCGAARRLAHEPGQRLPDTIPVRRRIDTDGVGRQRHERDTVGGRQSIEEPRRGVEHGLPLARPDVLFVHDEDDEPSHQI
jgi:hypothetical protein